MRHCLYLHGFASGPTSTKAVFFKEKLEGIGFRVDVPDLNGSDFSNMTLTSQLAIIDRCLEQANGAGEILVFGSSMGGLLAVLAAQKHDKIDRLILMAPGFGLQRRWLEWLGQSGVDAWKQDGFVEVMHYATNTTERLSYDFIKDAERYDTENLQVTRPTLVIHGKNDETVPYEESVRFSELNSKHAQYHLLEADHGLLEHLDQMWSLTSNFLSTPAKS